MVVVAVVVVVAVAVAVAVDLTKRKKTLQDMSEQETQIVELSNPYAVGLPPQQYAMVESGKARSQAEAMGSIAIAKRFPRDEAAAYTLVMSACSRPAMAEVAEYEYSRGGTSITGPSIHIAKRIASAYGNIEYGWHELERNGASSTIEAFCWDKQSNTRTALTVTVKHWRDTKSGGYQLKEERDIYELCANMAARRMRACILSILPADIVDAAIEQCHKTLKGQSKEPIGDRVKKMAAAFSEQGVTIGMIETLIQSKIDACSENNLAKLRRIYAAIRDGVAKVEDHFNAAEPEPSSDPSAPKRGRPPGTPNKPKVTEAPPEPTPTSTELPIDALSPEQEALYKAVTAAGGTFDLFQKAAIVEGWDGKAELWTGFGDVPSKLAAGLALLPNLKPSLDNRR